jgi:hypothetical protein
MLLALVLVGAVVAGVVVIEGRANRLALPPARVKHRVTTTTVAPTPPPPVVTALAPFTLPVPIGQPVVLAGGPSALLVVGGAPPTGAPAKGAFLVSTSGSGLHLAATLVTGVSDASGVLLGGRDLVFGGAAPGATAAVQAWSASRPSKAAQAAVATTTGALPATRAGSGAAEVHGSAYVVGGWDGAQPDGQVVATANGSSFTVAGLLAVPVRNPAVAAVGGKVYVFGGDALTRPAPANPRSGRAARAGAGRAGAVRHPTRGTAPVTTTVPAPAARWLPVDDIQVFDPATGRSAVVGHLPTAVQGAVAVNLGGHIYVAGGNGPAGTNAAVWGFEQSVGRVVQEGALPTGVSGAGAAVIGDQAWLVGGRAADGKLIGSLQTVRARPGASAAARPTSAIPRATPSTTGPARAKRAG